MNGYNSSNDSNNKTPSQKIVPSFLQEERAEDGKREKKKKVNCQLIYSKYWKTDMHMKDAIDVSLSLSIFLFVYQLVACATYNIDLAGEKLKLKNKLLPDDNDFERAGFHVRLTTMNKMVKDPFYFGDKNVVNAHWYDSSSYTM